MCSGLAQYILFAGNLQCNSPPTCRKWVAWAARWQLSRPPGGGPAAWPASWALGWGRAPSAWGAASCERTGIWREPSVSPCRRKRKKHSCQQRPVAVRAASLCRGSAANAPSVCHIHEEFAPLIVGGATYLSYTRMFAGTAAMKPTSLLLVLTRTPQCHWDDQLGGCRALKWKTMVSLKMWVR